jgi:hypothetical protein
MIWFETFDDTWVNPKFSSASGHRRFILIFNPNPVCSIFIDEHLSFSFFCDIAAIHSLRAEWHRKIPLAIQGDDTTISS